MAGVGVSVPSTRVLLSKRVQEMVLTGEELPAAYICRSKYDKEEEEMVEDLMNSPIPIIDLGWFSPGNSSTGESKEELEKLKSALSTWGCCQAIGHGIPGSFLDSVRGNGREFFEQPMEEKKKYAKELMEFEGYGADPVPEEGQSLDWSDRIFLGLEPEDERNYRFWPQNPTSFKKTLEEYTEKIKVVSEMITKAMARSLNLEENCFLNQFGKRPLLGGRFTYYSACKWPDLVLGQKPHADSSVYTIILQDEPGLQILNHSKWFTVPYNPLVLLVIMGDQMEIMSNGVFKSPVHRVICNAEKDRISVSMFNAPEPGKEIGPEEGLISASTPRLFKSVKNYQEIHAKYYYKGMRSLHIAQV